jgi:hypothetical protein
MGEHLKASARLADIWDEDVDDFLNGRSALRPRLDAWFNAYSGKGRGQVQDALPELYLGSLAKTPKAVFLALNPGRAHPEFQSREGIFAPEIRRLGTYRAWAQTWAYIREPWVSAKGPNRHLRSRLKFMRQWYNDANLSAEDMIHFELYPWHSVGLTARLLPDHGIIREFVWEPIAELNAPYIFAFGADWFPVIEGLGIEILDCIGKGGRPYATRVESRAVIIGRTPSGTLIVAEKHSGSAGPPAADEVEVLKSEIIK